MKEIILIKSGELALKGLNRKTFESILIKNLSASLRSIGTTNIKIAQSAIFIEPEGEFDFPLALERVGKVFGISTFSRAVICDKSIGDIFAKSAEYLKDQLLAAKTFKVNAKRSDKTFPLKSPQICEALGEFLLETFPHLTVDVHNPDVTVTVEVRDYAAYVRGSKLVGAGGLPSGTAGRAVTLISGGIDSPVASYMMAKRGLDLYAVHFASPPYTSKRAENKMKSLLAKVAAFSGGITLYVVPFTEIQETLKEKCPEDYITVLMRRFMMRIAEKIALKFNCGALITGESLAQVASQTLPAIHCTDTVCQLPVLRPLIGMDKEEIIKISKKIDTFETSILPYEDCCTVFTPAHPRTRPSILQCEKAEKALDFDLLINNATKDLRFERIYSDSVFD